MFWFFEHDQVGGDLHGKDVYSQISISLYLTTATFTSAGGQQFTPHSNAGRLFAFSWALWCLLTVSSYTANLASFLVVKRSAASGINSIQDAIQQNAQICVWGDAADYELMRAEFPLANLFKSRDHEHALLDLANGYCSAAVLTPPAWQVSLLYLLPRTAPFLPTPVHLLLSSLTPSEHVALPCLLPCTQLRISLPGAASLVLIYSRHACHSHDANNQVLQKRQKRSLNPQFLTLIRYHSHRSLGASKNSTATAPCSTWGDQCIR